MSLTLPRVAPVSYAEDLRVLLERGDVDQASFCFTVKRDRWEMEMREDGTEVAHHTILEVGELYDVCVTAQGAYPATESLPNVQQHVFSRARAYVADVDNVEPEVTPSAQEETVEEPRKATPAEIAKAKARARRARG